MGHTVQPARPGGAALALGQIVHTAGPLQSRVRVGEFGPR